MKRSIIALALAMSVASCASTEGDINNHWSERSIAPRVSRFFLGYDAQRDGSYMDFQWQRKQDINLTLRRHFLHHNPDNPNHADVPSRYEPRPNHSPLPNPVNYIHLEGVLIGLGIFASGGAFLPLPIDSLIATFEPGGIGEFVDGIGEAVRPIGVVTTSAINFFGFDQDEDGEEVEASYAHVKQLR